MSQRFESSTVTPVRLWATQLVKLRQREHSSPITLSPLSSLSITHPLYPCHIEASVSGNHLYVKLDTTHWSAAAWGRKLFLLTTSVSGCEILRQAVLLPVACGRWRNDHPRAQGSSTWKDRPSRWIVPAQPSWKQGNWPNVIKDPGGWSYKSNLHHFFTALLIQDAALLSGCVSLSTFWLTALLLFREDSHTLSLWCVFLSCFYLK